MIIHREELDQVLGGNRLLLFGRRKTGKTYYTLLKKEGWEYSIVRSKNEVLVGDTVMELPAFLKYASREDKLIIDEFHRAGELLFDYVQAHRLPENLILITSTLHFFRKIPHYSKIFGILPEYRVGLVSPSDLLRSGSLERFSLEELVFWQEPTQIGKRLNEMLLTGKYFVQELVGEILSEEDMAIHQKLRGILLATAGSTTSLSEIAGKMAKKGYIKRAETGLVTPYISMAIKIGILERVPVWNSRKHLYRHASPLTDLFYYLDDRYAYFERDLPPNFLLKVIRERISLYIEQFLERFLAEKYGLTPAKSLKPEIDVLLLDFKKPSIVAEVKWKNRITKEEVRKAEEKLSIFYEARKILFVKDASSVPETDLEVWDIETLVKLAQGVS